MYNVTNEFPPFFRFIAIKIGRKFVESSDVILPRPLVHETKSKEGEALVLLGERTHKHYNYLQKLNKTEDIYKRKAGRLG
jgi:hypothetical protein